MTKTNICNLALGRLGNQRVASIEEDSPAGEYLRTHFDNVRRALLRRFHWNFATTAAILSESADAGPLAAATAYDYDHAYVLPSDYIAVMRFNCIESGTGRTPWKIANNILFTDDDEASLEYIRDETDCTKWDDEFCNAVSWFLAAAIAPSLSSDANLGMKLLQTAEGFLKSAESGDTHEGKLEILRGAKYSQYAAARRGWGSGMAQAEIAAAAYRDFNGF